MGECFYISFVVNGWDWFSVVDSSLSLREVEWLRGVLLMLRCKTNDAMNKFLLPVVAHTREGKEEGRLWWLVACGWLSGEGRLL